MSHNNGWISLDKVQPFTSGSKLVYSPTVGIVMAHWSKADQFWLTDDGATFTGDLTHWQPLPFAPGEGL